MTVLEVKGIRYYTKEKNILDIPSLEIEEGKTLSIVGPNGAGKSTLLKVLALLQKPDEGEIFYRGTVVTKTNALEIRRKMSVVFQEPLLLDGTVYENLEIGLKIRKIRKEKRKGLIEEWLEKLGIYHLRNKHVSTLSGGEAQRVSLARALVLEPEILFLDEPFSSLDQPTKEGLIQDIYLVLKNNHVTTFFVTHDFREMQYFSDIACVMIDGKIAQKAKPVDILNKPADERIAKFVGIENIFNGIISEIENDIYSVVLDDSKIKIKANGQYEYKIGQKIRVLIRPENISLTENKRGIENTFDGIITEVYPTGYSWKYKFSVADKTFIGSLNTNNIEVYPGKEGFICIKPESVFLISKDMI